MPKIETRGRKRIGTELTVPYACAVAPELKEAMKEEAERRNMSLSQMGAYAMQRWLNAQEHVRQIDELNEGGEIRHDV